MIKIEKTDKSEIKIDKNEVYRYLGYKKQEVNRECAELIEKCINEVESAANYSACYERFPIKINGDGSIDLGFCTAVSESLKKNLSGCGEIFLFVATLGTGVDRIINKYSLTSPARAVMVQAAGAAAIEEWCDHICKRLAALCIGEGKYLRPRFSPGYGDLALEMQKPIFSVLDANRKIGATLSESYLMLPTKTVSAIVGIGGEKMDCYAKGCKACAKKNCEFRKED